MVPRIPYTLTVAGGALSVKSAAILKSHSKTEAWSPGNSSAGILERRNTASRMKGYEFHRVAVASVISWPG